MANTDFKKTIKGVVTQLVSILNQRNKDIISRRFGLKTGAKETLESIGASYGITRERVRQIEEASMKQMREHLSEGFETKIKPFVTLVEGIIDQEGGVIREHDLFVKFFDDAKTGSANAGLVFLLSLDSKLKRYIEDEEFNTFWSLNNDKQKEFVTLVTTVVKTLNKHDAPVEDQELSKIFAQLPTKEPLSKIIPNVIAISKEISKNIFNQIGLASWPEIKPRGVRDKSFLVLKRAAQPKHFREITQLINQHGFSKHKANVQTVHNELIKDKRFVLVGRGIYGLSEWGYERGTIKELIANILKKQGPMHKDKVIAQVMSTRFVKPNTIVLGLKDKKLFEHDPKGVVKLRK